MYRVALQPDQAGAPHLLKGPVDVDRGEPDRLGELDLGHRHVATACHRQPHRAEPVEDPAEQMTETLKRAARPRLTVHSRWIKTIAGSWDRKARSGVGGRL